MSTVVPLTRTFGWIVDLDVEGQALRDTVAMLAKRAKRSRVLSYGALRSLFQEELAFLRSERPAGFVTALWRHHNLGLLTRLIAACGERNGYVSLRGLHWLRHASHSRRALEAALATTQDPEIERRLKTTYRHGE
ncbi:MAG TPA: hypothetical protein VG963_33030 [Polyangiaceae bacterium]|nr:hypothetical protein [Polyangiaceae bacterium]